MESIRSDSRTARLLVEALGAAPFTLIDVGCSGGIHGGWDVFGDRLRCFAFDPSVREIERLTAAETRPDVHYINGFVGLPDGHPAKGASIEPWRLDPWGRLACLATLTSQQAGEEAAAADIGSPDTGPSAPAGTAAVEPEPQVQPALADDQDQSLMKRNLWHMARLADPSATIVLPEFLAAMGIDDLDFIKIDVDGVDFEILQSLDATLQDPSVLGAALEVSFHGSASEHDNTFHNIDRFMRARGFDLLDLSIRKYSLAVLPRPYLALHPFAAQNTGGRPFQGDALYLRDPFHRRLQPPPALSADKLLKLAALFALADLLDHAVEVLIRNRERLQDRVDIDAILDIAAAESQDLDGDLWGDHRFAGYGEMIRAFEADDPMFYDAWDRRHRRRMQLEEDSALARTQADELTAGRAKIAAQAADAEALIAEAARLEAARASSESRLIQAQADHAAAVNEVQAMRGTLSWRLTAGLRALRRRVR